MTAELILEFEGVTEKEYFAVNKELGLDPRAARATGPKAWCRTRPASTTRTTSS